MRVKATSMPTFSILTNALCTRRSRLLGVGGALVLLASGCAEGKQAADKKVEALSRPGNAPTATAAPPPMVVAPPPLPKGPKVEFSDNDFVESDKSRDPFRSFAAGFIEAAKKPNVNQRDVILSDFAVDELKLSGLIMSGDYPRAMVIDPRGKGWFIKKGDYLGKPDIVRVGGASGSEYQLNWRVDRVRAQDLVLIREDPAQPGIPPATKVVPLHPEGENEKAPQRR
jgi:type IV pilus assembly protein PilP